MNAGKIRGICEMNNPMVHKLLEQINRTLGSRCKLL